MIKRQKLIEKKSRKGKPQYAGSKRSEITEQQEAQPEQKRRIARLDYHVQSIKPEYTMNPIYTGGRILVGQQLIYACCDNRIVVFDPSQNKQVSIISHPNEEIVNFCLSHSEALIVTFTNNYLLRVLDAGNHRELNCIKINKHFVLDLAFAPNDKYLAIACVNSVVRVYSVAGLKQTHQYRKHRFSVRRIDWHPDPNKLQLASLDEEGNFIVFDYVLNQVVFSIPDFGKNFIFTDSGKTVISCGKDIRLWNFSTCKLQHTFQVGEREIDTLCLIDLGHGSKGEEEHAHAIGLLFGGEEVPLSILNLRDEEQPPQQIDGLCYGALMKIMKLGHSKKIVVVSHQQNISVVSYRQNSFTLEATFLGYNDEVIDVKFSKATLDGYFDTQSQLMVVATNSPLVKLVDLRSKNCHLIAGHKDIVLCVDYSYPYIVSAGKDKVVKLWRIDPMGLGDNRVALVANYKGHSEDVTGVVMAPNRQLIASVSEDKTIKLWAFPAGEKVEIKSSLFTVVAHDKSINSVRCNHDETLLASCSQDRTIKIWDAQKLALKLVLKGHRRSVWDTAFNKLEKILASAAADGTVKIWNLTNGECISTMGEGAALLRIQWLHHNQVVTGSLDGIIRIWDIRKLTSNSFDKHEGKIWSLDVSALDDKGKQGISVGNCIIVSGANDSRIILWEDETEEKQLEKLRDSSKDEQDKFIYSRYMQEEDYVRAARIAFESDLTEMFIKAVSAMVNRYNEQKRPAKLEEDQIVVAGESDFDVLKCQSDMAQLVSSLVETDLARLLRILQDMNSTVRHFKLANLLFREIVKRRSLEELVSVGKTYSDERNKSKGTADEFNSELQSDFEQFVQRMRLLNERHATRLETYARRSYWMDFCWKKAEEL